MPSCLLDNNLVLVPLTEGMGWEQLEWFAVVCSSRLLCGVITVVW